jgi:hypothetical protein
VADIARLAATWLSALAVTSALLAAVGYETRDADSRAYIAITTRLVDEPVSRWVAPQWWGAWGGQGLFREHPAGTFVPPALLARAGYPVEQSLFVVTLASQIVSLLALAALAGTIVPAAHARVLVWALQVIPIAFVFRVRANQEYLLLAGVLMTVYAVDRARAAPGWTLVAVAASAFALLVKGVFGLLAPLSAVLWLWSRRRTGGIGRNGWTALLAVGATPVALAWLYERAYGAATGQSFLEYYLGSRIGLTGGTTGLPFPMDKCWNALWYAGRLLWYAAPWSAVALLLFGRRQAHVPSGTRDFVRFTLLAAGVAIIGVAARDAKADRYIFPAYFLAASAGVVLACARWRWAAEAAGRLDRFWPWGPAALWLALVGGRILAAR